MGLGPLDPYVLGQLLLGDGRWASTEINAAQNAHYTRNWVVRKGITILMKSGDISVSGYRPRESNPGFRGNLRYNYQLRQGGCIKLDESIHGVAVEIPTNHREIPGSTPGRYNLQIEITSHSRLATELTHPQKSIFAIFRASFWITSI